MPELGLGRSSRAISPQVRPWSSELDCKHKALLSAPDRLQAPIAVLQDTGLNRTDSLPVVDKSCLFPRQPEVRCPLKMDVPAAVIWDFRAGWADQITIKKLDRLILGWADDAFRQLFWVLQVCSPSSERFSIPRQCSKFTPTL